MHRIGLMVLGWVASVALTLVDAAEYNADDYPMYYADHLEEDYNETAHKRNMDFVRNYIFPKFWDWVLIASHSIIFVVGLIDRQRDGLHSRVQEPHDENGHELLHRESSRGGLPGYPALPA